MEGEKVSLSMNIGGSPMEWIMASSWSSIGWSKMELSQKIAIDIRLKSFLSIDGFKIAPNGRNFLFMMILLVLENGKSAVELLQEYYANEVVRKRHF
jgi:hypothetical protein